MSAGSSTSSSEHSGSDDPDVIVVSRIAAVLRDARIKQGLTLRQVAGRMKIDNTHLSRVERGIVYPGLIVLLRWCRALDLKPDKLLKDALEK